MPISQDDFIDAVQTATAENGKLDIIQQYIAENPDDLNRLFPGTMAVVLFSPLCIALYASNEFTFKVLLNLGADVNAPGSEAHGIQESILDNIHECYALDVDLNAEKYKLFLILLLNEKKNDIKVDDILDVMMTAEYQYLDYFVDKVGINIINENGQNALQRLFSQRDVYPAQSATIKLVKNLLDLGININQQSIHGNTAFHTLLSRDLRLDQNIKVEHYVELFEIILNHPKLDVTLKNKNGKSIYDYKLECSQLTEMMLKDKVKRDLINAMHTARLSNLSFFSCIPRDILTFTGPFILDNRSVSTGRGELTAEAHTPETPHAIRN